MHNYAEVVNEARNAFNRDITKPVDFRVKQLKALHRMLDENAEDLVAAVQKDIKKPYTEALLVEIESMKNEIKGMVYEIHNWIKPKKAGTNIILLLDKPYVFPQPYGVVLIIGPWNYPLCLVISPLIGAIAAGNCAIIKPSEKSPVTAKLMAQLIPQYLDQDCYHVVNGGVSETTALLNERFDYIFYTGSPPVGKKIREASNKYLTPCTLELGGKCPVYLDDDMDMDLAAHRILWGKMLNVGQTCVAPDYVLCSKTAEAKFLDAAKRVLLEFFGKEPETTPDLARIVNEDHFERVRKFLSCGKVAIGGDYDAKEKYIAPTILIDVDETDSVMQEEIFGPVLPILTVNTPEEAIKFINKREKPLTLYLFTAKQKMIDQFLTQTSSGSMCVNDTVVHLSVDTLPFGGVGMSGMGRYKGKYTFETFSHQRSVLVRSINIVGEYLGKARYPPYSNTKIQILKKFLAKRPNLTPPYLSHILIFLLGILTAYVIGGICTISSNGSHPKLL